MLSTYSSLFTGNSIPHISAGRNPVFWFLRRGVGVHILPAAGFRRGSFTGTPRPLIYVTPGAAPSLQWKADGLSQSPRDVQTPKGLPSVPLRAKLLTLVTDKTSI